MEDLKYYELSDQVWCQVTWSYLVDELFVERTSTYGDWYW